MHKKVIKNETTTHMKHIINYLRRVYAHMQKDILPKPLVTYF